MKQIVVAICLAVGVSMVFNPFCSSAEDMDADKPSKELLYQDIVISTLLPRIQKRIDEFYSIKLTETPDVYPYMIYVLNAKRLDGFRSFLFSITFKVIPVVGPHIPVGVDQLTFKIGGSKVELTNFKHIKTEKLPPWWQHIVR